MKIQLRWSLTPGCVSTGLLEKPFVAFKFDEKISIRGKFNSLCPPGWKFRAGAKIACKHKLFSTQGELSYSQGTLR